MRVLVLHSHPLDDSYNRALFRQVCDSLAAAGHQVDACNLYAEAFDPVLSAHDRAIYHTVPQNRALVDDHVKRLLAAEALVLVTPVWNFGFPAILKGYFDRVWLPGVSFKLEDGRLTPTLRHIRKVAAVLTYGGTWWRAFLVGNPPRKIVTRVIRAQVALGAPIRFMAHYDMNNCTPETRAAFLDKVKAEMARF